MEEILALAKLTEVNGYMVDIDNYIEEHQKMLLYIKEKIEEIKDFKYHTNDMNTILTPYYTSYGLFSLRLEEALKLKDN